MQWSDECAGTVGLSQFELLDQTTRTIQVRSSKCGDVQQKADLQQRVIRFYINRYDRAGRFRVLVRGGRVRGWIGCDPGTRGMAISRHCLTVVTCEWQSW